MLAQDRTANSPFDIVVIGAGSAGLSAAQLAASLKASVAIVAPSRPSGECLNSGRFPSKAFYEAVHQWHSSFPAADVPSVEHASTAFSMAMRRATEAVERTLPNDSFARYGRLGVTCYSGRARIVGPHTVCFDDGGGESAIHARTIVIATGSTPCRPLEFGDGIRALGTDSLWSLASLPTELVVVGGGSLGCELSQAFARLGAAVVLVERSERVLPLESPEASKFMHDILTSAGVQVDLSSIIVKGENGDLRVDGPTGNRSVSARTLIWAVGRMPNTADLGLENVGLQLTSAGHIQVDTDMRTAQPSILACGDVVNPIGTTSGASAQVSRAITHGASSSKFSAVLRETPYRCADPE